MPDYYRRPDWFTRNVLNRSMAFFTALGFSVRGSAVLTVRGRKTGQSRSTPVNVLTYEGARYLVAPRGETEWARNLRVAGVAELRIGRRTEHLKARELSEDEKLPVLRAYLSKWKMETGMFFNGVTADTPDEKWREEAGRHPAFAVEPV